MFYWSNFLILWKVIFSSYSIIYVAILPAEVALLSKQGASVLYALLTKLNIFSLFYRWRYDITYTILHFTISDLLSRDSKQRKFSFFFDLCDFFTRISFDLPKARGGKGLHKLNKVKPYTVNNVESCLNKEITIIKLT